MVICFWLNQERMEIDVRLISILFHLDYPLSPMVRFFNTPTIRS